mgnify:CR=1 FL=1|jgi:hypothetical protein
MEFFKDVVRAAKDLTTSFTEMSKREAFNHLNRVYGGDKEKVAEGMRMWNEANPNAKGRSAEGSAEKD